MIEMYRPEDCGAEGAGVGSCGGAHRAVERRRSSRPISAITSGDGGGAPASSAAGINSAPNCDVIDFQSEESDVMDLR